MTIPLRRRLFYLYNGVRRRLEDLVARTGFYDRRGIPPPAIKRRIVREYAARYGADVFVETGTYMGEMVAAMLRRFRHIYSVELSDVLYEKAAARFARHPQVKVFHGDSATQMGRILREAEGRRTLFWLDAHWSGGSTARGDVVSPIVSELDQILSPSTGTPVILIDDAYCFVGANDYPTVDEICRQVARLRPDYIVSVQSDVIRIIPSLS